MECDGEGQPISRLEPWIDFDEALETSEQKACAYQEHQGERCLRHEQHAARAVGTRAVPTTPALLEGTEQRYPGGLQGWH